ncbi:HD-GYP domain-containing protein [Niallia circulans]|uniref:HD-GYP domain-containing protein n=1 Tax=Niallia circulans TaxID=1397 RepID=UPI001F380579|nr:HD domain-containing phosphohydrolase [Niallia circulans]MCF2648928.1 HD domain-containing protein [Niallia circulans]
MEKVTADITGYRIKEDVYSNSIEGLFLLKKGSTLTKKHVELLTKHQVNPFDVINPTEEASLSSENKEFSTLIDEVKETFHFIIEQQNDNVDRLLHTYEKAIDFSLQELAILDIIHKEVEPENYIYQHSINVGIISVIIGKVLGLARKECYLLSQMGLFHDIGMLKVDPSILQAQDRLTQKEYKEIQKHTIYGKSILFQISQLDILISRTALLHHEKINGKGYPSHRTEKNIPFLVQIVSVADMFNSMCSSHTHKEKKTYFEAINELVNESYGNALNPAIVIPFTNFIMRKQLFKKVTLSNNETAEIIFIHQNEPHLPLVRQEDSYIDLRKTSLKITGLAN